VPAERRQRGGFSVFQRRLPGRFAVSALMHALEDQDGDEIPDVSDSCPTVPNPDQADPDDDGVGFACDAKTPATTATTVRAATVVPSFGVAGNTFLDGVAFPVPIDLRGGIKPVTWTGRFSSDTPGITVQWKWAAAAYSQFSTDENALGVKPIDDKKASVYQNADRAGTPENFKAFVIGGARGGGGANFTGGYSGPTTAKCR